MDRSIVSQLLPFDPYDPQFLTDPYPTYRKIRESGPVVRTPAGVVSVIGHQEISAVLRDPAFGWGSGEPVADQFVPNPDGPPVRPILFLDPPDHTRIRSLITKAFSARMVDRLRPQAEELAAELIASAMTASGDGPVDLMEAVASPLPALLVSVLMGVPPGNHERFAAWASDSGRGLDPTFTLTPEQIERRDTARAAMMAYFRELADERRSEPADDLVSELVAVEQEGTKLTELELLTTCMALTLAGHGTTVNLIGNGMLALLRNPDQLDWFRSHPDQSANAVEELLRFDSPFQLGSRIALEPVELGEVSIAAGEQVFLLIGAANRDPVAYDTPDRLDLSRPPGRNLGFGLGIHYCIGAPMARLTAQVALAALARLDIRLAGEPQHGDGLVLRGLERLPVTLAGGPGR